MFCRYPNDEEPLEDKVMSFQEYVGKNTTS